MLAALALAVAAAAGGRLPNASGPSDAGARGDVDLRACPECVGHQWEVLQGVEDPDAAAKGRELADKVSVTESDRTHTVDNGVDRDYGDGYSEIVAFGGYTGTSLCSRIDRKEHVNGHTNCPLKRDWFKMWPPDANSFAGGIECWIDEMQTYQRGKTLNNAPGTTTVMGGCPAAGANASYGYKGGSYDWRYGGIRPQDNPDASLYPSIAAHIESVVAKTGKKVVIRGCSGGTINGYAFLMSQTRAWRQKYVMAFVAVSPVFGGTIASLSSIVYGWDIPSAGEAGRCIGRMVATLLPSVLWMWPHPGESYEKGEWNRTEVLIQTPKHNYTAYDLERMLVDMGLGGKTKELWALEKNDVLGAFEPPMVDTYVFYGYGISTIAGFSTGKNITVDEYGPSSCPPKDLGHLSRPWDDGDVTAPRRSCARAGSWAEPHAKAGVVLRNYGYKGNHHGCNCNLAECTTMYNCVMDKLAGKPHTGC